MSLPPMKNGMSPIKPIHFIVVSLLSFILIGALPGSFFMMLNYATAQLAGSCLSFFGVHPVINGDLISLNGFRVLIVPECTALYSIVLFSAFIFSVPASPKSRLVGLTAVIPFLFTANTIRIALITMVGAEYPAIFESVHIYLAQVVMLILVIGVSLAWMRHYTITVSLQGNLAVRALAWGSFLFIPWLLLNRLYMSGLDTLVAAAFMVAGVTLRFNYQHLLYYQTFNLVFFTALLCAEKRLTIRQRFAWGAVGTLAMVLGHLLIRWCNVFLTAFSWQPAIPVTTVLEVIGLYILPVLIWLIALNSAQKGMEYGNGDCKSV